MGRFGWRRTWWAALLCVALGGSSLGAAQVAPSDEVGFQNFLGDLRRQAEAQGRSPAAIEAVFAGLTLNTRVIELDRAQPGADPTAPIPMFEPYRRSHVDAQRIARGRTVYLAQRARLAKIERDTGVPESIMVAIWGHETNYGSVTGSFDLP
ncbi:MAG: lytic murein transglycosylase, partial [Sphingomonas sp.]|nr:lytic murein transglycosylase [Sphingomonas sp.]